MPALLLWALSGTVLAAEPEFSAEELGWISDHPVIRVHNEMDWPPFNFNEDGQPKGFSIDYMNLLASAAGLEVDYVSGPTWGEFFGMVQAGKLDVILNVTPTQERETYLNFTSSYLDTAVAVFVTEGSPSVSSLEDLAGRRLAVTEGLFAQEELSRDHPEIELVLVPNALESLYAILESRADAAIDILATISHLEQENTLSGLELGFIYRENSSATLNAIGVRKDWPILRDILQKTMDALDPPQLASLKQKWLDLEQYNSDKSAQTNALERFSWPLISILAAVFGAVLLSI